MGSGNLTTPAYANNGECRVCPKSWKFKYSHNTALKYTKHDLQYLPQINNAISLDDIPSEIRLDFSNVEVNFLYLDDQIAIYEDVSPDDLTHFLLFPVEHIESLDILKHPDLFKSMICAAHSILEIANFLDATVTISLKQDYVNYIPHYHMHVRANSEIDFDELKSKLYPYFYKDSRFY